MNTTGFAEHCTEGGATGSKAEGGNQRQASTTQTSGDHCNQCPFP
jgi:hypothetical protein